MDQSILNYIFKKFVAMSITTVVTGITTIVMGITTVATGVDNLYVAMGIDDIIISIATILLFKCARAPKP
jgi:hypothetical protein